MNKITLSRTARFSLMAATILAVAALSVFSTSWATPAQAQAGTGTVPNPPNKSAQSPCGNGPQSFVLSGTKNVTQTLGVNIGWVTLLSNQAAVGVPKAHAQFVPLTLLRVDLLDSAGLKPGPSGYTSLNCGMRTSAAVADGQAATFIPRSQQVCFDLPVGAAAAYKNLRIAYWNIDLGRWVFLDTIVGAKAACHTGFRLMPTNFALFGGS